MRIIFLFFLVIFSFLSSIAQVTLRDSLAVIAASPEPEKEKKKFDPSRLVFGGNLGASFGDYTFVNVSPQVGYMFSPMFTAGAGINYVHSSFKTRFSNEEIKETFNYAGINLFGRVFPTNFLFATLQPEINYSWGKIKFENNSQPDIEQDAEWIPTILVGAGVMLGGRGGRGGLMLSIQYDLAQNPRSPYGTSPFIGMGFSF
jgi:hypothetical protein